MHDLLTSDEDSVVAQNREWTARVAGWVVGLTLPWALAVLACLGTLTTSYVAPGAVFYAIWPTSLIGLVQWLWLLPAIAAAAYRPWGRPLATALLTSGASVLVVNLVLGGMFALLVTFTG